MRRKDREMGREFGLEVIDEAPFGVLSVVDAAGLPYALPLSLVREGNALYFHGAPAGTKTGLYEDETPCSVVFVSRHEVPELYSYEQVKELVEREETRTLASKVYTTQFSSAIVTGRLHRVLDEGEKVRALMLLCQKYTPRISDLAKPVVVKGSRYTAIYRVDIESLTAKRKAYDENGVELKSSI